MFTNTFYKTENAFICINFPCQMIEKINKEYCKNIRNIHIFVFNIKNVKVNKIKNIILECKRRNIKIRIHCFSKKDKIILKENFKEIKENPFFRIQLTKSFEIKMSEEKELYILENNINIIINNGETKECQTISFEYL